MKNNSFRLLSFSLFAFVFLSPLVASAQTGITLFVGGVYFEHVEQTGVSGGVYIPVSGNIEAGAEVAYFFAVEVDDGDETATHINLNLRYAIVNTAVRVYVLGGVNSYTWSWEQSGGSETESETQLHANIGGMAQFGAGRVGFFVAAKMMAGDTSSLVGSAGVTIGL